MIVNRRLSAEPIKEPTKIGSKERKTEVKKPSSEQAKLDDTWTYQNVHTPFPQSAVKVLGQTNMYVALWYRHGKPVMGRAWNDSGVVECQFAVDQKTFGGHDVGGSIQLLTYEGSHETKFYFYEWIGLVQWKSEYLSKLATRFAVRCGSAAPIYWPENKILGNYDIELNKASFSLNGKNVEVADSVVLNSMIILVKNTQGGPPYCPCAKCNAVQHQNPRKPMMVNDWGDFCWGNAWPTNKPMLRALGRSLSTPAGKQDHFVALWYRHGRPLMGRAWQNGNRIDASFTDNGKEFTGECVGSLQILVEIAATVAGFDYCWMPYEQASQHQDKDYEPVHINHIAPCVILDNKNFEILGQVNLKQERAEAAFRGHVVVVEGPQIKPLKVLCRKDRDDTITI